MATITLIEYIYSQLRNQPVFSFAYYLLLIISLQIIIEKF